MKFFAYLVILIFAVACATADMAVQSINTINHGNVVYVAKVGNNTTAQLGNPDRPFADPWAAVAAIPDSGWLVQFLDAGTYTFGPTGSGADFESPTTRNLEFNLAKNGVKMDMNHAVLKYTETESMDSLVGTVFYVDSFERFDIVNASVDLSTSDTANMYDINELTSVLISADYLASFYGDFDLIHVPEQSLTDYSVVYNISSSRNRREFKMKIDFLKGGHASFWVYGVQNPILDIDYCAASWQYFEGRVNAAMDTFARMTVKLGTVRGRLAISTYGEVDCHVGTWDYRGEVSLYRYPMTVWVNRYNSNTRNSRLNLDIGIMVNQYNGGFFGNPSGSDSSVTGSLIKAVVEQDCEAAINVGKGYYSGNRGSPSVVKEGVGSLILTGKLSANKSMLFTGGKVDISGLTFVTTDTTSTRATAATTVLCNGFRSNKAMSSVNTTKVGTEFINASVF